MIEDVTFDDTGVRRVSPEGGVEEVRWDDLTEVRIVTTDEGPFGKDVYWLLAGSDGRGGSRRSGGPRSPTTCSTAFNPSRATTTSR